MGLELQVPLGVLPKMPGHVALPGDTPRRRFPEEGGPRPGFFDDQHVPHAATEVRLKFCGHCCSPNEAFSPEVAAVSRGARAGGMVRKAPSHFDVEAHPEKPAPEERHTRLLGISSWVIFWARCGSAGACMMRQHRPCQLRFPNLGMQCKQHRSVHSAVADPSVAVVGRNADDDEGFDLDSREQPWGATSGLVPMTRGISSHLATRGPVLGPNVQASATSASRSCCERRRNEGRGKTRH